MHIRNISETFDVMKNIKLTALLLFLCAAIVNAQSSKKEEKEKLKEKQYQEILELVKSGNFEFVARKANPQRGRQIDLTTNPNFTRINGKSASADMPYFGRAFSAGYGSSDGGIKFDGQMESYDVQNNDKKRRVTIKFKVKGTDDTYSCTLIFSAKENATLSVTSNKRQVINYNGFVKEGPSGE